ncbi:MAG: hypothetical protein Q9165_000893 [Trypethelium subeluteriae]
MSGTPGSTRRATRSVTTRTPGAHPPVSLPMTGSARRGSNRPSGNLPGVDAARSTAYGARAKVRLPGLGSHLHAGEVGLAEAIEAETGPAPIAEEAEERQSVAREERSSLVQEEQPGAPEEPTVVPDEETVVPERSYVRETGTVAVHQRRERGSGPTPRRGNRTPRRRDRLDEELTQFSPWVQYYNWIVCFCVAVLVFLVGAMFTTALVNVRFASWVDEASKGLQDLSSDMVKEIVRDEVHNLVSPSIPSPPPPPPPRPPAFTLEEDPIEAVVAHFEVNFLSACLGAVVDPYLTSPTQIGDEGWVSQIYRRFFLPSAPNKPIAALMPWEDAGDAWCAAPTVTGLNHNDGTHGKAQLAVIMPYSVYPTSFTVEHIPMTGTLDVHSTPQWLELWAHVPDVGLRDALVAKVDTVMGSQLRSTDEQEDSHEHRPLPDPSAFRARDPKPTAGLSLAAQRRLNLGGPWEVPSDFVRIGRFRYDVAARHFVQTFDLPVSLVDWIATNKVLIRVTQTYGREWTCMYRFRLGGQLAEGATEYVSEEVREGREAAVHSSWKWF